MRSNLFRILLIIMLSLSNIIMFSETNGPSLAETRQKMKEAGIKKASAEAFEKAMQAKNHTQIKNLLLKSVELDGKNYYAYRALGNYYFDREYGNDLKKALEYYEKSFALNSSTPQPYVKLGKTYSELKNYEKAEYYYSEAIKKFPEDEESYLGMSQVLTEKGEKDEARYYAYKAEDVHNWRDSLRNREDNIKAAFYAQRAIEISGLKNSRAAENTDNEKTVTSPVTAISRYDNRNEKNPKDKAAKNSPKKQWAEDSKTLSEEKHDAASVNSAPALPDEDFMPAPPPSPIALPRNTYDDLDISYRSQSPTAGSKKNVDASTQEKEAQEQMRLSLEYFKNNEYKKGFDSFYENYSKYADFLDDNTITGITYLVRAYNRKIKDTDRELYNANVQKFKELEIFENPY